MYRAVLIDSFYAAIPNIHPVRDGREAVAANLHQVDSTVGASTVQLPALGAVVVWEAQAGSFLVQFSLTSIYCLETLRAEPPVHKIHNTKVL